MHQQSICGFVLIVLLLIVWLTVYFVLCSFLISELIRGQMLLSTIADGSKVDDYVVGSEAGCIPYSIILCFPQPCKSGKYWHCTYRDAHGDLSSSSTAT